MYIETNGLWAKDSMGAKEMINKFYDLGLEAIILGSGDKYHMEQGADGVQLHGEIKKILGVVAQERHSIYMPILIEGALPGHVMPFGRGKRLPAEDLAGSKKCKLPEVFGTNDRVTVSPSGDVYLCEWQVAPVGSAIERPIGDLLESAKNDAVLSMLIKSGPSEVAKKFGVQWDEGMSDCPQCEQVFSKAIREIV